MLLMLMYFLGPEKKSQNFDVQNECRCSVLCITGNVLHDAMSSLFLKDTINIEHFVLLLTRYTGVLFLFQVKGRDACVHLMVLSTDVTRPRTARLDSLQNHISNAIWPERTTLAVSIATDVMAAGT